MILVHGVTINKKGGITVESILTSIKLLLGITEDYDYFDAQIITHIYDSPTAGCWSPRRIHY